MVNLRRKDVLGKMKNIIVTGGAGFIGTNLCFSAIERGCHVTVFDNFSRKGSEENVEKIVAKGNGNVEILRGDVGVRTDVDALFDSHPNCDAVFHLAGQVAVTTSIKRPRLDFEANALGTFNILEAVRCKSPETVFLYASTNKVYGNLDGVEILDGPSGYRFNEFPHGIPETFPLDFHSPYGCSKGIGDQYTIDYARIYGLKTVVIRQSCIYGPHQFGIEDQGWVAWFSIASLLDHPITIFGDGKQVRDVLFVDDLIHAYWSAVENRGLTAGAAYNIGGGEFQLSLLQLVSRLEQILCKKIPLRFEAERSGDQNVYVSDTRKATADFGWTPKTTPDEGLKELIGWISKNSILFQ